MVGWHRDAGYKYYWNNSNHLIKAEVVSSGSVSKTIHYGYDDHGGRVSRDDGSKTQYLTDYSNPTGYSQVVAEYDPADPDSQRDYLYGSEILAQADSSAGLAHLHGDHLGSTRLLTGGAGNAISNSDYNYSPYGVPLNYADSSLTSSRFTGQSLDTDLSLQYHRARWLNTSTAGWLSMDPYFDFPNNFGNPFGYVGGSPTGNIDLRGKASLLETAFIAGVVSATVNMAIHSVANIGNLTIGGVLTAGVTGFSVGFLTVIASPGAGIITKCLGKLFGAASGSLALKMIGFMVYGALAGFANVIGYFENGMINDAFGPTDYYFDPSMGDMAIHFLGGFIVGGLFGKIKGAFSYKQSSCNMIPKARLIVTKMTSSGKELWIKCVSLPTFGQSSVFAVLNVAGYGPVDQSDSVVVDDLGGQGMMYYELPVTEDYIEQLNSFYNNILSDDHDI